jgi:ribonuclease HII
MILGIDEVGRGSVAGPLSVGFCLLSDDFPLECFYLGADGWNEFVDLDLQVWQAVRDSKKVRESQREMIASQLKNKVDHLIISASPELIDSFGIGVVLSHILWLGVLIYLDKNPDIRILADGKIKIIRSLNGFLLQQLILQNQLNIEISKYCQTDIFDSNQIQLKDKYWQFNQKIERVVKGDDRYLSISAASIFAKVNRDGVMKKLAKEYPKYNWEVNKGYATKKHLEAIVKNPENNYLRKSFLKKYIPSRGESAFSRVA